MIRVVHGRVPGRVRLRLSVLKRHSVLAEYLTANLQGRPGVRSIRVGTITGSVLVEYGSPLARHQDVLQLVQGVVEAFFESSRKTGPAESPVALSVPDRERGKTSSPIASANGRHTQSIACLDRLALKETEDEAWHNWTAHACLSRLHSAWNGISDEEARRRLTLHGPNELPDGPPVSQWRLFAKQFVSLPVALLGAVSVVSLITGGVFDALIISGVVVANAFIGYITEKASDEAISALRQLQEPEARVVRSAHEKMVPARDVVPGDVIVLRAGSSVPADARLLEVDQLFVDESSLSGESFPVAKTADVLLDATVPIHDRSNMVYRGTVVTGGSGLAVVTATGPRTQIGQLQHMLQNTESPKAPIELQLADLGNRLVLLCLAICAVCFGIGLARGYGLLAMARLSLALGAAAVPEGLPSAATTTFALAVRRMRQRGVLIRDLTAVEAVGAIQVLCVDKTGTLTENRMTVQEMVADGMRFTVHHNAVRLNGDVVDPLRHENLKKIFQIACLCNEIRLLEAPEDGGAIILEGSPTETALVRLAEDNGVVFRELREKFPIHSLCLRSEARAYMASVHSDGESDPWLAVKGSPEAVLDSCTRELRGGAIVPLTAERRRQILLENADLSAKGLRVLGFAYGTVNGCGPEVPGDWIWCGLVGMADPIKPGAKEMIAALRRAGVQVVMLTGDQELTASSVAKTLDLSDGRPLRIFDASRFSGSVVEDLNGNGSDIHVFSRVSPSLKLEVVQMLRRSGKVVGMTGDGINDAPALKAADVGVCMGQKGTTVAQSVANVVLENDDLILLVEVLEEGRTIHDNIKKSVRFFLSSNMSEIALMTAALVLGLPTPLNAMELLWINLISDIFPGIALSMEPPDKDVLSRPPRKAHAPLFSRSDFARMFRESGVLAAGSLLGSFYGLMRGGMAQASTMAFHTLSLSQLLHALVCRHADGASSKQPLSANPYLLTAVAGSCAAQVLAGVLPGLRSFLGLSPMGLVDWLVTGLCATAATVINDKAKTAQRRPLRLPAARSVGMGALELEGVEKKAGPGHRGPWLDERNQTVLWHASTSDP
uniref:Cation-transporting P-type ATPase n=1 Tax=Desulfacinum infernum TaxID=35837 RepID=A0A832A6G3_9BACT